MADAGIVLFPWRSNDRPASLWLRLVRKMFRLVRLQFPVISVLPSSTCLNHNTYISPLNRASLLHYIPGISGTGSSCQAFELIFIWPFVTPHTIQAAKTMFSNIVNVIINYDDNNSAFLYTTHDSFTKQTHSGQIIWYDPFIHLLTYILKQSSFKFSTQGIPSHAICYFQSVNYTPVARYQFSHSIDTRVAISKRHNFQINRQQTFSGYTREMEIFSLTDATGGQTPVTNRWISEDYPICLWLRDRLQVTAFTTWRWWTHWTRRLEIVSQSAGHPLRLICN